MAEMKVSRKKAPEKKSHGPNGSAKYALEQMASERPNSDHMVIEGHEHGFTTHHKMAGEDVKGPEGHKSRTALAKHVKSTMSGEESDGDE